MPFTSERFTLAKPLERPSRSGFVALPCDYPLGLPIAIQTWLSVMPLYHRCLMAPTNRATVVHRCEGSIAEAFALLCQKSNVYCCCHFPPPQNTELCVLICCPAATVTLLVTLETNYCGSPHQLLPWPLLPLPPLLSLLLFGNKMLTVFCFRFSSSLVVRCGFDKCHTLVATLRVVVHSPHTVNVCGCISRATTCDRSHSRAS